MGKCFMFQELFQKEIPRASKPSTITIKGTLGGHFPNLQ